MKREAKANIDHTFTSPFALEAAALRLKNVTKRGVAFGWDKLDSDKIAFQLSSRHGIGIVSGHLSRDDNQTLVTYRATRNFRSFVSFALSHIYPIISATFGVPFFLGLAVQALAKNAPFEVLMWLAGDFLVLSWLASTWRVAFREQNMIAQILYGTLRDPIPDIPDISRS